MKWSCINFGSPPPPRPNTKAEKPTSTKVEKSNNIFCGCSLKNQSNYAVQQAERTMECLWFYAVKGKKCVTTWRREYWIYLKNSFSKKGDLPPRLLDDLTITHHAILTITLLVSSQPLLFIFLNIWREIIFIVIFKINVFNKFH